MFLAFLSATLLVLGLVSTATGFSDAFLVMAAILLSLDLFIGFASLGRIGAAGDEDVRYLQGMNRLRHAYHEMVPGLDRYFITSPYDDFESAVQVYGPPETSAWRGIVHGFTTTPAMINVICCAVAGALAAVLVMLATHDGTVAALAGGLVFLVLLLMSIVVVTQLIKSFGRSLVVMFPRLNEGKTPDE
jgi:hypothetical protein